MLVVFYASSAAVAEVPAVTAGTEEAAFATTEPVAARKKN